jgi:hypothetical protein
MADGFPPMRLFEPCSIYDSRLRKHAVTIGTHISTRGLTVIGYRGTGMSAEVVEHTFEPLFATTEIDKGTGLGPVHRGRRSAPTGRAGGSNGNGAKARQVAAARGYLRGRHGRPRPRPRPLGRRTRRAARRITPGCELPRWSLRRHHVTNGGDGVFSYSDTNRRV